MNCFEDVLETALEGAGQAILAAAVTGRGVREWLWYSRDTEETISLVNPALRGYQPFLVEFDAQHDPQWDVYKQFQGIANV